MTESWSYRRLIPATNAKAYAIGTFGQTVRARWTTGYPTASSRMKTEMPVTSEVIRFGICSRRRAREPPRGHIVRARKSMPKSRIVNLEGGRGRGSGNYNVCRLHRFRRSKIIRETMAWLRAGWLARTPANGPCRARVRSRATHAAATHAWGRGCCAFRLENARRGQPRAAILRARLSKSIRGLHAYIGRPTDCDNSRNR